MRPAMITCPNCCSEMVKEYHSAKLNYTKEKNENWEVFKFICYACGFYRQQSRDIVFDNPRSMNEWLTRGKVL